MLETHPEPVQIDMDMLVHCINACYECAQACTYCADACLSEDDVQMLVRCIRVNMDCAAICELTGRILIRLTQPDWSLNRSLVEACETASRICGDECERHASHHEHCRICAEACRQCEITCSRLLNAVSAAV
jgi:hypothetical protein